MLQHFFCPNSVLQLGRWATGWFLGRLSPAMHSNNNNCNLELKTSFRFKVKYLQLTRFRLPWFQFFRITAKVLIGAAKLAARLQWRGRLQVPSGHFKSANWHKHIYPTSTGTSLLWKAYQRLYFPVGELNHRIRLIKPMYCYWEFSTPLPFITPHPLMCCSLFVSITEGVKGGGLGTEYPWRPESTGNYRTWW